MRKIVLLLAFWVALAQVIPVYAGEVPITEENLAQLRGKWEGYLKVYGSSQEQARSMEVLNDTVPLRGVLYVYGPLGNSIRDFDNGIIEKGKLLIRFDKRQWIRLALHISKKGKLELRGDFRWADLRGDWSGETYFEKIDQK
jgi:hypothetical protein